MVPSVAKTWAPQGCTPVHYHRQGRREKISVISAVSVSPKRQRLGLYYQLYQDSIGQREVCGFFRHLLRHLRGHVVVLIDNASMHRGGLVRQLAQEHPRLQVEYFPSYAPELNPDEGVWAWTKTNLANTCPRVVDELIEQILGKLENIRGSQDLLRGCILQSELPLFLR